MVITQNINLYVFSRRPTTVLFQVRHLKADDITYKTFVLLLYYSVIISNYLNKVILNLNFGCITMRFTQLFKLFHNDAFSINELTMT